MDSFNRTWQRDTFPNGSTTGQVVDRGERTIADSRNQRIFQTERYGTPLASALHRLAREADASIVWSATVSDASGIAAGTAFDFLGDATAEAMYADETNMFIFDDAGEVLLQTPRSSGTLSEYPVVADIDNDGSAEIVVVSNMISSATSPTVQAIRDVEDRWIQARRIWNQHTYHVTNVREDGTIPQVESPHWELFNTFRTNIQIENGGLCDPPIE